MAVPKPTRARRHWETVADAQLLDIDLTTEDPERLEGLVRSYPEGAEEPYVELKYDLRGSGREEFRCVHGNHGHLAGYVMRKGDKRYLVGHICGKNLYGENFERYTSDFDAARSRQASLRRTNEMRTAAGEFMTWLHEVLHSNVLTQFEDRIGYLENHAEWICENWPRARHFDPRLLRVKLPRTLFTDGCNPRSLLESVAKEFSIVALTLSQDVQKAAERLPQIKNRSERLLKEAETALEQLEELVTFFQPQVLTALCDLANKFDNPKRRRYQPELLAFTIKRANGSVKIALPKSYKVPDRTVLDRVRAAIAGNA